MMGLRLYTTLFWLLLPVFAFGQADASKSDDADSIFWRKHVIKLDKALKISDLDTVTRHDYLRLWLDDQVIEIWKEGKVGKGILVNWAREIVPSAETETGRYFYIKESLDSSKCAGIARSAVKYSIRNMPNSSRLPGWVNGFDGIEYLFESSQEGHYSLKSYWTPTAQHNLKGAQVIQAFVDEVCGVIDAPVRKKYFQAGIPFNSWAIHGGGMVVTRIVTQAESIRMKQERNRHRKFQKRQLQSQQ